MPLLNYSTTITVEKSLGEIQRQLTGHGARAILIEYGPRGEPDALSFKVLVGTQELGYRLPADWRPVLTLLQRQPKVPRRLQTEEQARRVAWRIVKDWIEAQMAIIETRMVTMEQVFLPYLLLPSGQTVYERVRESQFALPPATEAREGA